MPAWLAPVCEDRSVSHSGEPIAAVVEPARQVRRVPVAHGAAQDRQREAVDLEEQDPGTSPRSMTPWRRATRRRTAGASAWSSAPTSCATTVEMAAMSDGRQQRRREAETCTWSGRGSAATSIAPSSSSTSRKPSANMYGSGSAASSGGSTALSTRQDQGHESAAPVASSDTPGAIQVPTMTATTETSSAARRLPIPSEKRGGSPPSGRVRQRRGSSGHPTPAPWAPGASPEAGESQRRSRPSGSPGRGDARAGRRRSSCLVPRRAGRSAPHPPNRSVPVSRTTVVAPRGAAAHQTAGSSAPAARARPMSSSSSASPGTWPKV